MIQSAPFSEHFHEQNDHSNASGAKEQKIVNTNVSLWNMHTSNTPGMVVPELGRRQEPTQSVKPQQNAFLCYPLFGSWSRAGCTNFTSRLIKQATRRGRDWHPLWLHPQFHHCKTSLRSLARPRQENPACATLCLASGSSPSGLSMELQRPWRKVISIQIGDWKIRRACSINLNTGERS